jgi:hypothetical protein
MARKKPAKKAKQQARKKTASKSAARRGAKRSAAKKGGTKSAKRSAKPARSSAKAAAPARKPKKRTALARAVGVAVGAAAVAAGVRAAVAGGKKPNLDRPRKTVGDVRGIPSSLGAPGGASAAASGRQEMKDKLRKHTGSGPALTSGDLDADWESAESVGDEAPGGDNPTPDQDVVDDIGRALGVEYEDDEELQGGAEIKERDRHRWELDPASKDKDADDEE